MSASGQYTTLRLVEAAGVTKGGAFKDMMTEGENGIDVVAIEQVVGSVRDCGISWRSVIECLAFEGEQNGDTHPTIIPHYPRRLQLSTKHLPVRVKV